MTREWTGPDKKKLAALEHQVNMQSILIDKLYEIAGAALTHVYALEQLLEELGAITRAAVAARSQAIDVDITAEIELDSKYEDFRRHRDAIRGMQEEDEPSQQA
jgi:hypothetical protein